jgi:nitrite reductase/ring-hydroxylating ferredoxin subunit
MSLHGIDPCTTSLVMNFEIEHKGLFDCRTGAAKRAPELRTFPAHTEGGRFLVLVE